MTTCTILHARGSKLKKTTKEKCHLFCFYGEISQCFFVADARSNVVDLQLRNISIYTSTTEKVDNLLDLETDSEQRF